MAHIQNQHGAVTDPQTDEHGNPIHHTAGTAYGPGTGTGFDTTTGAGVGTHHVGAPTTGAGGLGMGDHNQGGRQELRRSGSSGSSSSEDDGQGGRRKKGMKEKIKEKIPGVGGNKHDTSHAKAAPGVYDNTGTGTHSQQGHEKKGVMDKIKEKLPGSHN